MSYPVAFLTLMANNTGKVTQISVTTNCGRIWRVMRTRALERLKQGHMLFVLLLMAQFQFWDGMMTQVFVGRGLVKEANPLMAPLVSGGSFLPLKLLGIAVLLILLWILYKRFPKMAVVAASSVCALSAVLIIWNFMVFFLPS
jgi:hypothetical protein